MSYDVLILVFLILVFCFFSMMLVVNVMFSVMNMSNGKEIKEIKLSDILGNRAKMPKKTKAQKEAERKYDIIMENLEAYDGTEIGQKEVK